MKRERGAGVLEYVGMVVVASLIVGAAAMAVSQGQVAPRTQAAICRILGGACTAPSLQLPASSQQCRVASSGPLGAPRIEYRVDLGGAGPAIVQELTGGGYRVLTSSDAPGRSIDAHSGPASPAHAATGVSASGATNLYFASSDAELAGVLQGISREQRQGAMFGTGDSAPAKAWAGLGGAFMDLTGEPAAPTASGRFEPTAGATSLTTQPSAHAYELALAAAGGEGAQSLGMVTMQGGTTVEYLSVRRSGSSAPTMLEIERDPGGFVTVVRATGFDAGGTPVQATLPTTSAATAGNAEALLSDAGVTSPRRYAQAPGGAASGDAWTGFLQAATHDGLTVKTNPVVHGAGGQTVSTAQLADAMRDARKDAPAAQQWDGSSWQPWDGCR